MCLLPRYIIFTLGETGVVGVAMLPLLLARSGGAIRAQSTLGLWSTLLLMMGLQGGKSIFGSNATARTHHSNRTSATLEVAVVSNGWYWCDGAVVLLFRGASGDYESVRASGYTQIFGLFSAIERPWARPEPFTWDTSVGTFRRDLWTVFIFKAESFGFSGLVVGYGDCLIGDWAWVSLPLWGYWSRGRLGRNSEFVWSVNSIADVLVRLHTAFTVFCVVYDRYGCGWECCSSTDRKVFLSLACFYLRLLWGGLSLRMPTTPIPESECILPTEFDGPVLVWPWDGSDDQWFESSLKSRLFQLQHEQPGATIATGSWDLEGTVFPGKRLRDVGWRKAMDRQGTLNISQLYNWGYRYVIVDETRVEAVKTARDDVFG